MAGVEPATASKPPVRKPAPWEHRPPGSTPATPEVLPAFEPCRLSVRERTFFRGAKDDTYRKRSLRPEIDTQFGAGLPTPPSRRPQVSPISAGQSNVDGTLERRLPPRRYRPSRGSLRDPGSAPADGGAPLRAQAPETRQDQGRRHRSRARLLALPGPRRGTGSARNERFGSAGPGRQILVGTLDAISDRPGKGFPIAVASLGRGAGDVRLERLGGAAIATGPFLERAIDGLHRGGTRCCVPGGAVRRVIGGLVLQGFIHAAHEAD